MLKTGAEYLESIRDGREVYIGREEVTDVTTHLAFRNAAQSFASSTTVSATPTTSTSCPMRRR